MKYAIGLDCGIASVGYAVMELDSYDEPQRIIRLGSRIFDRAEHPKDGSSLALPRREARGTRRRIRRHKHRIERIRYLLVDNNIISTEELNTLFEGQLTDIYQLRCKALDNPVSNTEFARILINLSQRRGFKSNRKVDAEDKKNDAGKLLSAVSDNEKLMLTKGYRTVGEMLYKDDKYKEHKRNKGEDYQNTVSRKMIEDEIREIFKSQRGFDMPFANESIENAYIDIVLSQRPFDVGPGKGNKNSPSAYSGDQIEKMIGKCTFFPDEPRAAKATYSFQLFTLLQNINNIVLVNESGERKTLSNSEKDILREYCFNTKSVSFSSIRKKLGIDKQYRFNSISYGDNEIDEIEKKTKFEFLKQYHAVKKVLGDAIKTLSIDDLDEVGRIFTIYKNDERIIKELEKTELEPYLYDKLLELQPFSKFGHISVKACQMIIPYLEQGMLYNEACEAAGISFKAHNGKEKGMLLPASAPELEDITNPVVKRAVSQTIKVVNAIIREQGHSPVYINIELARELSKSKKERDAIEKNYNENQAYNNKIKEQLKNEFKLLYPRGQDIIKLKLWYEQDGICPYSRKKIELERLFEVGYVDIDHIIPYSLSYDDSYNNKVLTLSAENRQKGNRIPLDYIPENMQGEYKGWVENNIKNFKKKQALLKKKLTKEDTDGFKSRNLNDTKYLSRALFNFIKDNLEFEEFENKNKNHVTAVNGTVTSYMRKRWGIVKIREDGDLHHAVDAVVIACVTSGMIQKVTKYSQYREIRYSEVFDDGSYGFTNDGEFVDEFPFPYNEFRKELEIRTEVEDEKRLHLLLETLPNYSKDDIDNTKPCFVSRMPNHKVTGAAHEETIRSGKEKGYSISKVDLSSLKLDKDGEIKDYYKKEDDRLLYNALKQRLIEFDGDGEKAFKDFEMHKPKADGSDGPIVKKVKMIKRSTLNVKARGDKGIADNGSMVRIDVFFVEGEGYYFVPIYVADTVEKELPNKACVAKKSYDEWKDMNDDNFIFSLYPNDLIKITAKKDIKFNVNLKGSTLPKTKLLNNAFVYYKSANIANGSIEVIINDNAYLREGLGIKTLKSIEKYSVDAIGNIYKVNKEKRMGFR